MAYQQVGQYPNQPPHYNQPPYNNNQQPLQPPQYGSTQGVQVITAQPTPVVGTIHVTEKPVNANGALILSALVAVFCGLMSPVTLCCSIPAVILAIMAMDGPNIQERASNVRSSFVLSIVALSIGSIATIISIIYVSIALS